MDLGASSLATYKAKKDKKNRQIYKIYLPVEEDDAVAKIDWGRSPERALVNRR